MGSRGRSWERIINGIFLIEGIAYDHMDELSIQYISKPYEEEL